jgi:hypothetical protein
LRRRYDAKTPTALFDPGESIYVRDVIAPCGIDDAIALYFDKRVSAMSPGSGSRAVRTAGVVRSAGGRREEGREMFGPVVSLADADAQ